MNIRTKLILSVGILAGMIILLVALSVVNLQILTATEPDSPAAMPGLQRALLWISVTGGICILASIVLLVWLPRSINKPIRELTQGILEIANHNYEKRLDMSEHEEFREVADSFNSMAERLTEYRTSTLNDILSAKKFLEAIVNSIHEPIIGLNRGHEILFINKEALTVLNLKREDVIRRSAEELSLKNDLLRRLVRELINPGEKKEPLKIYADNKESYFQASYITIMNTDADTDESHNLGDVILLKNITEFKELDTAKTTFISTISHELKTPISAILMSLQLLEDNRVVAYDYGIISGILFLLIYLYSLYRAFRLCLKGNWTCIVFLLAILCFGMAEMVLVSGQITVTLMAIIFYFTGRDGYTLTLKSREVAEET